MPAVLVKKIHEIKKTLPFLATQHTFQKHYVNLKDTLDSCTYIQLHIFYYLPLSFAKFHNFQVKTVHLKNTLSPNGPSSKIHQFKRIVKI